jgi:hypothetical protein
MSPIFSGSKSKLAACTMRSFFIGFLLDPEDGSDVFSKHRLAFKGLHCVTCQKITFFKLTTTGVLLLLTYARLCRLE